MAVFFFGDDVIFSSQNKEYNFSNVSKYMNELGQLYTTGDKSNSYNEKSLKDVQFLQRKFKKRPGIMYAPLNKDSIEQQFNYTYISENDYRTIAVQIDEACLEAVAHGTEYFAEFTGALKEKVLRTNLKFKVPINFDSKFYQQKLIKRIAEA